MKTKILYVLAASAALSLTACYKTYTCKCTSANSSSEGQIKAVSKTRAQKFCEKKNCSDGTAEVY